MSARLMRTKARLFESLPKISRDVKKSTHEDEDKKKKSSLPALARKKSELVGKSKRNTDADDAGSPEVDKLDLSDMAEDDSGPAASSGGEQKNESPEASAKLPRLKDDDARRNSSKLVGQSQGDDAGVAEGDVEEEVTEDGNDEFVSETTDGDEEPDGDIEGLRPYEDTSEEEDEDAEKDVVHGGGLEGDEPDGGEEPENPESAEPEDGASLKQAESSDKTPKHKEDFYPTPATGFELTVIGDEEHNHRLATTMVDKMDIGAANKAFLQSIIEEKRFPDYDFYSVCAFANVFDNAKKELSKVDLKRLVNAVKPKSVNDLKMLFESIAYGIGLYELQPEVVSQLIEMAVNPPSQRLADPFIDMTTYSDFRAPSVNDFLEIAAAIEGNKKLGNMDWGKLSDIIRDLEQTYDWDEIVNMVATAKSQKELKQNVTKKSDDVPIVDTESGIDKETGEQTDVLVKGDGKRKKGKRKRPQTDFSFESASKKDAKGRIDLINEELVIRGGGETANDSDNERLKELAEMTFGVDSVFVLDYFSSEKDRSALLECLDGLGEKSLSSFRKLDWHDVILASGITDASAFCSSILVPFDKGNALDKSGLDSDDVCDLLSLCVVEGAPFIGVLSRFGESGARSVESFVDVSKAVVSNDALDLTIEETDELVSHLLKHYSPEEAVEVAEGIEDADSRLELNYLDYILDGDIVGYAEDEDDDAEDD